MNIPHFFSLFRMCVFSSLFLPPFLTTCIRSKAVVTIWVFLFSTVVSVSLSLPHTHTLAVLLSLSLSLYHSLFLKHTLFAQLSPFAHMRPALVWLIHFLGFSSTNYYYYYDYNDTYAHIFLDLMVRSKKSFEHISLPVFQPLLY